MPEVKVPSNIPTDYRAGHEKARKLAPETADNYVAHTLVGDPLADAMMEDLAGVSRQEQALLFQAALQDRDWHDLPDLPASARAFFEATETVPDWVDFDSFIPGIRHVPPELPSHPGRICRRHVGGRLCHQHRKVILHHRQSTGPGSTEAEAEQPPHDRDIHA